MPYLLLIKTLIYRWHWQWIVREWGVEGIQITFFFSLARRNSEDFFPLLIDDDATTVLYYTLPNREFSYLCHFLLLLAVSCVPLISRDFCSLWINIDSFLCRISVLLTDWWSRCTSYDGTNMTLDEYFENTDFHSLFLSQVEKFGQSQIVHWF